MPKIDIYQTQVAPDAVSPGRRATGEDFGAGVGNAIQGLAGAGYGLANTMMSVQESQDVAQARISAAALRARWTKRATDAMMAAQSAVPQSAPPDKLSNTGDFQPRPDDATTRAMGYDGDVTKFAETMQQNFADDAQQLREKLTTRAGQEIFDRTMEPVGETLRYRFVGLQSHLVGAKAVSDYQQQTGYLAQAVQSDPTQLQGALDQVRGSPDGQFVKVGGLNIPDSVDAQTAAKLKADAVGQITRGAIMGMAHQDPQRTIDAIANGELDYTGISEQDKEWGVRFARQEAKGKAIELRAQATQSKQALKVQQTNDENTLLDAYATGKLTSWDQIKSTSLDPARKEHWLGMMEKSAADGGPTMATNPEVFRDLQKRIYAPWGTKGKISDPSEIDNHFADLKPSDQKFLRSEVVNQLSPEGDTLQKDKAELLKSAEGQLRTAQYGMPDADAANKLYRFSWDLEAAMDAQRKAGKNPRDLLNPNSKDFFGARIGQYKTSRQQILQNGADAVRAQNPALAPQPVKPPTRSQMTNDFLNGGLK